MKSFEKAFISDRAGISILEFLADELPLSKTKIKDAMQKGAVWLNREGQEPERVRRAKDPVKLSDEIHIYFDESFLAIKLPPLQLIDDQEQYSVWSKPFGLMDEVTLYGDHLSLERALVRDLPHALDCYYVDPDQVSISGLMLIAHNKVTASKLIEQYDSDKIIKDYQITVVGKHQESKVVLAADSQEIDLTPINYNSYNDSSVIAISRASGAEDQIFELLKQAGFTIFDDEGLICSKIAFTSPLTGRAVEYSFKSSLLI